MTLNELKNIAVNIRLDIVEMVWKAGSGHIGGALSSVEILTALYFDALSIRPGEPKWVNRDRFVLSKGHSAIGLYAVLSRRGFFDRQMLFTEFIKADGRLQEHPNMREITGIEMSSGSLGQGISAAAGMAYGLRMKKNPASIFCLMGCGEQQEGQVWEAALVAGHYKLGNLTGIIDYNRLQVNGSMDQIMEVEPLDDKWRAFGWDVYHVDGHNLEKILALMQTLKSRLDNDKPALIIAKTIKGKGVDFMENNYEYHAGSFTEEDYKKAVISVERTR